VRVSCIVDSITGKMGLVGEQNVTNHMGVRINPKAQFQPVINVHWLKMLNALDVVWIQHSQHLVTFWHDCNEFTTKMA